MSLAAISTVVDAAVYANKIHAGVTISGQDMAGLTPEEATAALTKYVDEAKDRSVNLVSDSKTWELSPDFHRSER